MSSRLPVRLLVALLMLTGCDLEPDARVTNISAGRGQQVVLQAQSVPAEEVYWVFTESPPGVTGRFIWEFPEEAWFIAGLEGEYIVDRWAVSGPAQVWTDRFVVNAQGELRQLRVLGPTPIRLGESAEYEVRLADDSLQLPGLTFEWTLRYEDEFEELSLETTLSGNRATFVPDRLGRYALTAKGTFDFGETLHRTLYVYVR